MTEPVLITALLFYVNADIHLGNVIGSILSGDVHARFSRKKGLKVVYVCGTDEYGTATEMKAMQEKVTCRELCDKYYVLQKKSVDWFNISYDIFGRTTNESQEELAHTIFTNLWKNGYLEEQECDQLWCEMCNGCRKIR